MWLRGLAVVHARVPVRAFVRPHIAEVPDRPTTELGDGPREVVAASPVSERLLRDLEQLGDLMNTAESNGRPLLSHARDGAGRAAGSRPAAPRSGCLARARASSR